MVALLLAMAAAATASAPSLHGGHPASLKYFGWYGDVTSTLDVTGPSSNLVQARSPSSAIVAAAAGQKVLLYVGAFFPTLYGKRDRVSDHFSAISHVFSAPYAAPPHRVLT